MMAAFDVIKVNIPDLEALNLNDNKLHMLDHFKLLDKKAPNLKILYMANNKQTIGCYRWVEEPELFPSLSSMDHSAVLMAVIDWIPEMVHEVTGCEIGASGTAESAGRC
ncbi:hypothetical protein pipiens_012003 [Culex pipiens pipiens]|uniref:NXF1/2/3/5-like leucine-rich repeat domain-containing protein n=1 Tax=Culex pipiens pipiens TaxID=38569 RepID=A0ABD1D4P4_CULPP